MLQQLSFLNPRCQVEWDKGHALAHLLEALGLAGCDDVLPIYIGDDRCVRRHLRPDVCSL